MYGYQELNELTPEQVLQKVTQEQIFAFVLEQSFNPQIKYKSLFREDDRPNCRFETREDGTILFVDFGDITTHRTCWRAVMDKFDVNLTRAVDIVCSHFNLSTKLSEYKIPEAKTFIANSNDYIDKEAPIITFDKRPIERRDKLFLGQFIIKPEHLIEDNVFPTSTYYIQYKGKSKKQIRVYAICYAIDFIDAVKLYQPYSTDYKFITNCNENHIGNIDNLPKTGEQLIIKKSWKDHRVIRNLELGLNVIWFQNETIIPSIEILQNLLNRFKQITIFYDNDNAGMKGAIKLANILNNIRANSTRIVYLPKELGYKDPGVFISKEGRKDTIEMLKQIKLI